MWSATDEWFSRLGNRAGGAGEGSLPGISPLMLFLAPIFSAASAPLNSSALWHKRVGLNISEPIRKEKWLTMIILSTGNRRFLPSGKYFTCAFLWALGPPLHAQPQTGLNHQFKSLKQSKNQWSSEFCGWFRDKIPGNCVCKCCVCWSQCMFRFLAPVNHSIMEHMSMFSAPLLVFLMWCSYGWRQLLSSKWEHLGRK